MKNSKLGFLSGVTLLACSALPLLATTSVDWSGTSTLPTVGGDAVFNVDNGSMHVLLKNILKTLPGSPDIADAGQLLTGVSFKVTGVSSLSLTAATVTGRTVAGDGSFVDTPNVNLLTVNGGGASWELTSASGKFQLDFNPDAKYALISAPSASGKYVGNGSINGNPGHNPFAAGTADFTLTNAGITSASQIKDVTFIFNTTLSDKVPGMPGVTSNIGVVPLPGAAWTGLSLLLPLGGIAWLRRRSAHKVAI